MVTYDKWLAMDELAGYSKTAARCGMQAKFRLEQLIEEAVRA